MNTPDFVKNVTQNEAHHEGPVAKKLEKQTAKLPSDFFLWGAIGSMVASAALQLAGQQKLSNFLGLWAPSILVLGLYNKIVKVAGSDRTDGRGSIGRA